MTNVQKQQTAVSRRVPDEVITTLEGLQNECFEIQSMDPGPRKFFRVAEATQALIDVFKRPGVMDSFMMMQGSPLGFRTDRDHNGGYNVNIVRDAVIQGMLIGIFPVNNQMNIIGSRMYIPKEGFEYLLSNAPYDGIRNLEYYRFDHMEFVKEHPEIKAASIMSTLVWKCKGSPEESFTRTVQVIFHGVEKKNNIDMAFGKAEAKMLQWLYKRLTNLHIPQGDAAVDEDAINTTATVSIPADQEQLQKINELLQKVHPKVKESMKERLSEKNWLITQDEANSIIGPLTKKARMYQESHKNTTPDSDDSNHEPGVIVSDDEKSRAMLEREMHQIGTDMFGDDWISARRDAIKRVNQDKKSTKDLDIDELRTVIDMLKMLGN